MLFGCLQNWHLSVRCLEMTFRLPRLFRDDVFTESESWLRLSTQTIPHTLVSEIMYDSYCQVLIETQPFLVRHPDDHFFSFIHVKL